MYRFFVFFSSLNSVSVTYFFFLITPSKDGRLTSGLLDTEWFLLSQYLTLYSFFLWEPSAMVQIQLGSAFALDVSLLIPFSVGQISRARWNLHNSRSWIVENQYGLGDQSWWMNMLQ